MIIGLGLVLPINSLPADKSVPELYKANITSLPGLAIYSHLHLFCPIADCHISQTELLYKCSSTGICITPTNSKHASDHKETLQHRVGTKPLLRQQKHTGKRA